MTATATTQKCVAIDEHAKAPVQEPLVSVLTLTKDSMESIGRCVESVLAQSYPHVEYVVQDGQSTDGTLELLSRYGDRIRVISEEDAGPQDAHLRGLLRCTGDIVTTCWADEELAPDAVAWGVEALRKEPETAGIYGDVIETDLRGNFLRPPLHVGRGTRWDLSRYLCWDIIPTYVGSFFWRSKLEEAGVFNDPHCLMYDYFAKVGVRWPIKYVPGFVGKFAVHKKQLSSTPKVIHQMVEDVMRSIDALMQDGTTPEAVRANEREIRAGIYLSVIPTLVTNADAIADAKVMLTRALQFEPNTQQLTRIAWDIYDYLTIKRRFSEALDFFDALLHAQRRIPGLTTGRAFSLFLQQRTGEITHALCS